MTSTSGTERMRLTYIAAGTLSSAWLESRIMASSVPKMIPPVIAIAVSVSVNVIPSLKRKGRERWMTSKSKPANMSVPRQGSAAGADQARDLHALLDPAHAVYHDQRDADVDEGRGGERLEHLEAEFLHRAGARGELHQPDGECDRRILDDVHELGGERRQDDAERLRQQHVAVRLGQR